MVFAFKSPIGGVYKWNYDVSADGITAKAAIIIETSGGEVISDDVDLLEMIDKEMDDGNLATGNIQIGSTNSLVYHHRKMTPPYRVTLVNLTAGAKAVAPTADKLEVGQLTAEEIYQLAGNLLKLDMSGNPHAEPGIIVQRGRKVLANCRPCRTASRVQEHLVV